MTSAIVGRLRAAGCVFAEDEARLILGEARSATELEDMIGRRVAGLPLERILGWAEFYGMRILLDPGVFVPRRRTELVVAEALRLLSGRAGNEESAAVVVDLCCGSGAVGAAISARLPAVELYASDLDPVAVACARRNIGAARVFQGNLYEPLPAQLRGRVDILAANAPYVPSSAVDMMPPEARLYEPLLSLDGGPDGLRVQHQVIAGAAGWLADGGHLLIETSERQAPLTAGLFTDHGLAPWVARSDDLDATVVIGRRPV